MRNTWPVFKKEMRSYFLSPIAYVVGAAFLAICGYFFYANLIYYSLLSFRGHSNPLLADFLNLTEMVIAPFFRNVGVLTLFVVPLLTMRLFAEEKKLGTIELLLTYPVRDGEAVAGKFLACIAVYLLILLLGSFYPLTVVFLGKPEAGPLFTGYLGLILLGGMAVSVGLFASSLTENQIVAAVITFTILLLLWGLGWVSEISSSPLTRALEYISPRGHFDSLSKGVIETKGIVAFLIHMVFFLFMTMRLLEARRWRG